MAIGPAVTVEHWLRDARSDAPLARDDVWCARGDAFTDWDRGTGDEA